VEPCFVRKKRIVQHINPFLWKNHVVELLRNWQPTKLKQGSEIVLNNWANAESVHCCEVWG
jgi:hypothetical protein